jgi:hypothetical protein
VSGDVQGSHSPSSTRHWKPAASPPGERKRKLGVASSVRFLGPRRILVFGGTASKERGLAAGTVPTAWNWAVTERLAETVRLCDCASPSDQPENP